jgi:hypothetical protein
MATNTYVALDTRTLVTATNEVTFSSIPGTYTDLKIVVNGSFATEDYIVMQLNGDISTNYSETQLRGNGSSPTSGAASNRAFTALESLGAGANERFMTQINIMNYANTTTFKTILTRSDNASRVTSATASLWRKTPEAVTSVKLYGLQGYNFNIGSIFSLYGIAAEGAGPTAKATGGMITSDSTYYYHTFTSTGVFTPSVSLSADLFMVAGGGGGGTGNTDGTGGGGGAGGYRLLSAQTIPATACTVTVGAGGAVLTSGSNSSIAGSGLTTISSTGGGRGTGLTTPAASGGSGGGGAGNNLPTGGAGNAGSYSPVEGFAGGTTIAFSGSGGGGAAGIGIADTYNGSTGTAGNGGPGTAINATWASAVGFGVNGFIAGGGGGGRDGKRSMTAAIGGVGGGGNGCSAGLSGQPGTANSGGGGGGGGNLNSTEYVAAAGGSGIVIVRYLKA